MIADLFMIGLFVVGGLGLIFVLAKVGVLTP